ncbi:MAG: hypothetical protein LC768_04300 [Acidobacteria bacterium]|nr:hypothetical protein [Acidobacteriota bacterium]MCA1637547.1 hypothetical protein [Acidobacteriota bacterium]
MSLVFASAAKAQSTDMDNPTVLTSNVIEGEDAGFRKARNFFETDLSVLSR